MAEARRMGLQDELELRVIASLLHNPDWLGEAAALLREDDFELEDAAALFAALRTLFLDGKPVTAVSVALEAGDGTNDLVHALMRGGLGAVSREEAAFLFDSLQSRSRLRRINSLAFRLSNATDADYAGHLIDEINGATVRRQEARVVSIQDALVDFVSRLDETPVYLPWGMRRLDAEVFAEPGDFIVIGGYSSSGKTLLALQFAMVHAQRYKVGFFSLETNDRKLIDRMVSARAQVDLKKIKRRELDTAEEDRLMGSVQELGKLDLTVVDASGMTVSDIQAVALQHRFEIIVVDYLQIIPEAGYNMTEQVSRISMGLHRLAQSHGITVLALSQLSRPERPRTGKPTPPNMHSLRESGQIEQDADVIFLLYPKDPDDNGSNRILKLAKNKEGEKLSLELAFDGATQTLTPVSGDKAVAQKLANDGRKAKRQYRQEAMEGFTDLSDNEEVPF